MIFSKPYVRRRRRPVHVCRPITSSLMPGSLPHERARPDLPEAQIRDAGPVFVGYWSAKPGQAGLKLNWLSTWLNWIRKENAPSAAAQRQARLVEPSKFGSAEVRAKDAQVAAKYGATIVGRSRQ